MAAKGTGQWVPGLPEPPGVVVAGRRGREGQLQAGCFARAAWPMGMPDTLVPPCYCQLRVWVPCPSGHVRGARTNLGGSSWYVYAAHGCDSVRCRTLPQQIGETAQAVDDLMATDFLERVRFAGEGAATDRILQRLEAQLATMQTPRGGAAQPRARLSSTGSSGSSSGVEAVAGVRLADPAALERVAAWVAEAVAGGEAEPAAGLADGGGEELQVSPFCGRRFPCSVSAALLAGTGLG